MESALSKQRFMMVAGARPNFMKIAPVVRTLEQAGHECTIVHTGQHYGDSMSDAIFRQLELPEPKYNLQVGSGSHAVQTAKILERFEPALLEQHPDWLVLVGDVNSTMACSLVAAKLKFNHGIKVAHIEAGLRSGDWRMPEEVNRLITDMLSDLLLAPSHDAADTLRREGRSEKDICMVGNVMVDTLLHSLKSARQIDQARRYGLMPKSYAVVTLHRPSNVDQTDALKNYIQIIKAISQIFPIVWVLHPRIATAVQQELRSDTSNIHLVESLPYLQMLSLIDSASVVLTDSGGLQEETTVLNVPCITLRENTERPVTLTHGSNRMAKWPIDKDHLIRQTEFLLKEARQRELNLTIPGWDGKAAQRAMHAMVAHRESTR